MFSALDVLGLRSPILIVSPHPDDDILASGGLIQRALSLGKSIFVLYLTAGDANTDSVRKFLHLPVVPKSFIRLGQVRHDEAVRAEAFLGVPRSHLFFLSFPDDTTLRIAKSASPAKVVRSRFTRLTRASYPFAFRFNAPYSRAVAIKLIRTILKQVKPQTILLPLSADTNPDHEAARILTLSALRCTSIRPTILSYLIHFPNWPPAKGVFQPPKQLLSPRIRRLALSASELNRKRRAFQLEPSQFNVSTLDRRLVRPSEFFWIGSAPI